MSHASPARILVIEDNPTNLDLMVYLFRAFGYAPSTATDGEQGLAAVREEVPDLILCDVYLPKMGGCEVAAAIKSDEALRHIPTIAVTALAMVGDRERIMASGFDGYITKPITPETFVQQAERYLPADLQVARPASLVEAAREAGAILPRTVRRDITVLIVDDTQHNIDFMRSTLEPFGYHVLEAGNVREALKIAAGTEIALVLCDLHMGPESGRDLLAIAPSSPGLEEIPLVIVSSTFSSEYECTECLKAGAAHFIKRPIEPQALLAEIENVLETREDPKGGKNPGS